MGNVAESFQNACVGEREHPSAEPLADAHMNEKLEDATPETAETTLVTDKEAVARTLQRKKKANPCFICLCAGCVFCISAIVTLIVSTAIFMVLTRRPCNVQVLGEWDEWTHSNVELGTDRNEHHIPVDLTGLWWKRWTRSGSWDSWFHAVAKMEIGLSFAFLKSNSSTFPMNITVPVNWPGGRLFSDTIWSRLLVVRSAGVDVNELLVIVFQNETYGEIMDEDRVAWTMTQTSEDRWAVTDGGQKEYELTRIVTGEQEKHPVFWDYFMEDLGSHSGRTFRFSDTCNRTCGVYRTSCERCEHTCKVQT